LRQLYGAGGANNKKGEEREKEERREKERKRGEKERRKREKEKTKINHSTVGSTVRRSLAIELMVSEYDRSDNSS
jgi:hypothetical protein